MNLEFKTLEACCISIADGDHQPPPKSESGIPFVTISNISSNQFDFSNTMFVPIEYYSNLDEKRKPRKGDILYSVVGSFGIPVLIKDDAPFVFQRHIAILRPNPQIIDSRFLFYTMLSCGFYAKADAAAIGAAQRTISLSSLRSIKILLPSLSVQKHIADILSAYDDLIENNQKQIKLLEEAAQRLYKEWFVDLRFPGWENTKIVDGVPEGWERLPLPQIADIQYGFAFDGSLFNSSGYGTPIVRIRNIPDAETSDFTSEEASSEYLINNGDIIVGMDGEFHINSWAGGQAYLVQRTCCIRPKIEKIRGWLLYSIHEPIKYFEKTIVGATVAHLGKKHLDSITLLVPTEELYAPFISIFDKRQILMEENIKLREVRDRLIYVLMSTN